MSVQLIIYPQNYRGYGSPLAASANESVVNGINFVGLDIASSYDSSAANTILDVLTNAAPSIVNTWYRFRTTSAGTPSLPTVTSGNLVLNSTTTTTLSGVYQRLSNLIVGQQYTFTIDISTPAANGSVVVSAFDGTSILTQHSVAASLSQITHSFTATAANNTIMISYFNTIVNNVTISSISVQPSAVAPSGAVQSLDNGQVICDLYEDEDIPLSLSVDNFKNVAEKVQSYSKAFKLPATKRNNRIFDNMFEITRTDDGIIFNPYNKTECVLKQDGFILFKGYLKMLDITDKEGEISYNVNLYSEVVALADILKDRTFSELDFTELSHDYTKASIKDSWYEPSTGTGLPLNIPLSTSSYAYDTTNQPAYGTSQTNVLKYPFVDWNHQFIVAAPGGTPTEGNPQLPNLESAFRPFIQLKYLINKIFEPTPFTWESSFFDSVDFGKLFMDFNWGGNEFPVPSNTYIGLWEVVGSLSANTGTGSFKALRVVPESVEPLLTGSQVPPNYQGDPSAANPYILTATTTNEMYNVNYRFNLRNNSGSGSSCLCRWIHKIGGVAQPPINLRNLSFPFGNSSGLYFGVFDITLNTGDTLEAQFDGPSNIEQHQSFESKVIFVQSTSLINSEVLLTTRGEVEQWGFLKGIMTMFNLVSLPDEDDPNNIKFEPYGDIFISDTAGRTLSDRSIQHDWTDKIDVSEIKLTPLTDLNKNTIFKFVEDDEDFCFMEYKRQVGGHLYGSLTYDASLSSGGLATVLQGEKEIIAEPFAATICAALMPQYSGIVIPKIYANSDDETEGFDNAPRVLYNNGINPTGASYFIPAQNGLSSENQSDYLQFSHIKNGGTSLSNYQDFHFGECQTAPGVGYTLNNLFNLYWLPYYQELYNPDTRTMTIKVNLSPSEINTFKFNDTVMIKNRQFRVNKIDYKPNDLATVEFILIP